MGNIKRKHSTPFKVKVALDLLREKETVAAICSRYGVHPTQAGRWKDKALETMATGFDNKSALADQKQKDELIGELYKQIGQLKVELDWLKKIWALSKDKRRKFISPGNAEIPITRQCELLGVSRSGYYYEPRPESEKNICLMRRIDEIYTKLPYYGAPKITAQLRREGEAVNHERIERLMGVMGIEAIFPKKNLSRNGKNHRKYPYLLNKLDINRPNYVWGTDITYIRALGQWFYLAAIIDWYSRYVISWKLSPSLENDFCIACLEEALEVATPEIHNSDQGVQFTAEDYVAILEARESIRISMDGRGRCFDNIFTERLWRNVKYEEVYLKEYASFAEAEQSLAEYFHAYNYERIHESLNYLTPAEVYFGINLNEGLKNEALKSPQTNEAMARRLLMPAAPRNFITPIAKISKVEINHINCQFTV